MVASEPVSSIRSMICRHRASNAKALTAGSSKRFRGYALRRIRHSPSPLAAPLITAPMTASSRTTTMTVTGMRHQADVSHRHVPCNNDQIMAPTTRRAMMPQQPPPPELPDDLGFRDHQIGMMIHPVSSATSRLSRVKWAVFIAPTVSSTDKAHHRSRVRHRSPGAHGHFAQHPDPPQTEELLSYSGLPVGPLIRRRGNKVIIVKDAKRTLAGTKEPRRCDLGSDRPCSATG